MTLDERTLRAAGLPASLISLLVSITKAADRAVAAANTASVANDLEPQIAAAVQALRDMEMAPGLATQIGTLANRLMQVEAVNSVVSLDREDNRLVLVMADGSRITGPKVTEPVEDPEIVLTGGALTMDGPDLVIIPPTASIQGGSDFVAIFEQALA